MFLALVGPPELEREKELGELGDGELVSGWLAQGARRVGRDWEFLPLPDFGDVGDVAKRGLARAGSVAPVAGGADPEMCDEAATARPSVAAWA